MNTADGVCKILIQIIQVCVYTHSYTYIDFLDIFICGIYIISPPVPLKRASTITFTFKHLAIGCNLKFEILHFCETHCFHNHLHQHCFYKSRSMASPWLPLLE